MIAATAEALFGDTANTLRTILVVEDDELIRILASEFLHDCGFIVIEAGDVAEAKDLLLNRHVDLVFSDINLPNRESGFALEKWVRQYYPGMKVLLTSGHPQLPAETRNLREPLIQKPYSFSALLRRIASALEPAIA